MGVFIVVGLSVALEEMHPFQCYRFRLPFLAPIRNGHLRGLNVSVMQDPPSAMVVTLACAPNSLALRWSEAGMSDPNWPLPLSDTLSVICCWLAWRRMLTSVASVWRLMLIKHSL